MDFIYIEDVARANLLAAAIDSTDAVFNVASGVETSLLELAHLLIEVMGSDVSVEYGPERAVNKVPRRLADTRTARELLGFEAKVDLEEGLRRLVDWWRAERAEAQHRRPSRPHPDLALVTIPIRRMRRSPPATDPGRDENRIERLSGLFSV